jgi:hypothetical protein
VNKVSDLIKGNFVAVTVNQLNGVDKESANGKFIFSLGKRQENYFQVATPGGQLVAGLALSGVTGDAKKEVLTALRKWQQMPESERKPAPITNQEAAEPTFKSRAEAPSGGLILRVYQRNMKRDAKGDYALITRNDVRDKTVYRDPAWIWGNSIYTEPMPDIMWLTETDWNSLVPEHPKKGATFNVPAPVQKRLFRYHLVDGTFGLPGSWKLSDIQHEKLTLTVEETAPLVRMRLRGYALLATDPDLAKAKHGYEAALHGVLTYDPSKKAFTRFDFVAVGECWGGDWEGGRFSRGGRAPLGIAFELARGDRVSDHVPPKGRNFNRDFGERYFLAQKK